MEFFNNFLQGRIYVRTADLETLLGLLSQLESELKLPAGQLIQTSTEKFPTYFDRNDFTRSAQEIVETYGVARYQ
jgi:vacuolar-type H+-ATPase subunit I/STV1